MESANSTTPMLCLSTGNGRSAADGVPASKKTQV
jgi:hypothetical protein